ncbi:MAG: GTPase domain-containing protein [Marinilabiliaceae bacterium]
MTSNNDTQSQVRAAYARLSKILDNSASSVNDLVGVNSQFDSIQSTVAGAIASKADEVRRECGETLNSVVWDRLVIAFFGTTNAGKSTLIETFRILYGGDDRSDVGSIVGDGRRDFTKDYAEYDLIVDGVPFTLIDVPGIEGNEREYTDKIKTALRKAHIVFYVHGENTKPNEKIAEKIKHYLAEWVKVYTVYNVRGGVGNYDEEDERATLLTGGVRTSEGNIVRTFKGVLGGTYAGNVTVQALLAMCAKAKFSADRSDLIGYQRKLLKLFSEGGSLDAAHVADRILSFSRLPELVKLVKGCAANFTDEIVEANKRKLIYLANMSLSEIESVANEQEECIDNLESQLDSYQSAVSFGVPASENAIRCQVRSAIERKFRELKEAIYSIIDDGSAKSKKSKVDSVQRRVIRELESEVGCVVAGELNKLQEKVDRKSDELDGVYLPYLSFGGSCNFAEDIDFSGALENLGTDSADVVNGAASVAGGAATGAALGSFIPGIGTLIGGVIGGAIGVAARALGSDAGKGDAKNEVSRAIDEATKLTKDRLPYALHDVFEEMDNAVDEARSAVADEKENIEELRSAVSKATSELRRFCSKLKKSKYGTV